MEKCDYNLSKAKKKKRCFLERESPFPVPIASIAGVAAGNDKWCYYTGQLLDNYVQVTHSGDMELLNNMGFFGERSVWGRHGQRAATWQRRRGRRGRAAEARRLHIISRRKYLRRLGWRAQTEGTVEEDGETTLPMDKLPLRMPTDYPAHEIDMEDSLNQHQSVDTSDSKRVVTCQGEPDQSGHGCAEMPGTSVADAHLGTTVCDDATETSAWDRVTPAGTSAWDEAAAENDPWASTTEEEAADFWGTSEATAEKSNTIDNISQSQACDSVTTVDSNRVEGMGGLKETEARDPVSSGDKIEPAESNVSSDHKSSNSELSVCDNDHCSTKEFNMSPHSVQNTDNLLQSSPSQSDSHLTEFPPDIGHDASKQVSSNQRENTRTPVTSCSRHNDVDPRCLSDHEDGALLVVNDTDESDREGGASGGEERLQWQPAVKRNPYAVKETLHLTFEEAFFLCYGLGCLVVLDEQKNPMKLTTMWKEFCKRQPHFLQNYIVYHNFRSKGWVPKPGIKFGGDFVVYKEGPPFYHSTYVVLVRLVDEVSYRSLSDGQHPTNTWPALAAQNRITEQAAKELMICYVVKPAHLSPEDLMSPKCIPHFKIQELVVKRWLLKHERDNLNYMEIP